MKKITLLFAALTPLFTFHANAQSPRLVLFEEFTQASCPPCAATNPGLNTLLNANGDKLVSVKYQTSWPGTDPMNVQNPTQVATRVTYYAVTGVPDGEMDGNVFNAHPATLTQAIITNRANVMSHFTIDVSHYLSPAHDSIYVHALITCTQALTGTTVVGHMAVIERNVYFTTAPGTNGEKHFEGVMKKMLPSDQGSALPAVWNVGDTHMIDQSWKLVSVYDTNQLAAVVWMQDNSTKEIFQAGYSRPHIPNDAGVTLITGVPPVLCASSISPVVRLHNFAVTPLTSATISYTIDAGAPVPYSWTGNLASNGDLNVTLSAITLAAGHHNLSFYTTLPNGSPDLDSHNDASAAGTTIMSAAVPAPISQAFPTALFPPAGWSVENVDADAYTWTRSGTGLNGAGSALLSFFSASAGTIDNLYTPLLDYSNAISGATLEFDVAHAQYAATYLDRLKVDVSTNCGATWTNVYNKVDPALASTTTLVTTSFVPTAAQWRHETINMNPYIGQASLLVRFQGVSGYGNNVYVDNINLNDGSVGISTINAAAGISLYPNPSNGEVNLKLDFQNTQNVTVIVTNTIGSVVSTLNLKDVNSGTYPLNLVGQAKGNYMVTIKTNDNVVTKRISITE